MAANILAIVDATTIVIHSGDLNNGGTMHAQVPLGSHPRNTHGYTAALRAGGWIVNGQWGWTPVAQGALPAVAVRRA